MVDFLICVGLLMCSMGIFIGPYVLHKKVNNHMDTKVASYLGMIPRALLMFIGAFLMNSTRG